jgi:hypothetical protein
MEQTRNLNRYGNAEDPTKDYYEIEDSELGQQYQPGIFQEGTGEDASYCCYCCGKNFIEGITGCGSTPQEAYNDWEKQIREHLDKRIG